MLLGASAPGSPGTLALLFASQALSWAGVPALGATAMAAAGGLASQGELPLWAVLVMGTAGAQAGGIVGWFIGRRSGQGARRRTGRFAGTWQKALASGERFADRWGRLMVFFVPAWVAGALGLPLRQFVIWNLVAAAAWTVGAGLAAYGVGFAISGGPALDSAASILIGATVVLAVVALFVRRRRLSA